MVAENQFNLPQVSKLFRVRDHPIEMIQIEADLPYESYRPGDTVYGTFKAQLKDGRTFDSRPSLTV